MSISQGESETRGSDVAIVGKWLGACRTYKKEGAFAPSFWV